MSSRRTFPSAKAAGTRSTQADVLAQYVLIIVADERVMLALMFYRGEFKFFCSGIFELNRESVSDSHGSFTSAERISLRDDPRWVALYRACDEQGLTCERLPKDSLGFHRSGRTLRCGACSRFACIHACIHQSCAGDVADAVVHKR